jgi:tape measure domain-containing protein
MTTLSFDLLFHDRGVAKGLQNVGRQADVAHSQFARFSAGAGAALGKAGSALGKVGSLATKFGAGAALAIGAAGTAAVGFGLKTASANEQAMISFTTMLGSAQKAHVFLRKLQAFAAATPFEFPELQTAASSLISVGIKADNVIPIMKTLGDVTAGMGTGSEGIKRATVALQQMNAAGKIQAEDLNQLRDAGIPVYDLLSAALGKSKKQIADLVSSGDLAKMGQQPVDAMMAALKAGKGLDRFAGLMEKQSHSLAGMWSTVKDTFGQGLANAIAPSFSLIKTGLEEISKTGAVAFGWVGKHKGDLSEIFSVAGSTLKSFGHIASGTLGAFTGSIAHGHDAVKSFADFLVTHQADITGVLVTGGKAALGLGKAMAMGSSIGLRAFAFLLDGMVTGTQTILDTIRLIAGGEVAAFGWIPGLGPKLKAGLAAFDAFEKAAINGGRGAANAARAAADGIDKHVLPAIGKAQSSLDKLGNTEIAKAKLRDTASKAALAIRDVGTSADGSQVKLKHFSDASKLGANEQAGLRHRLDDARSALRNQINAMQDAHASQGHLTQAWKTGRDRLYDEFRQMGLSREEARKLARQYAGMPPKVRTPIEQPGMKEARRQIEGLHQDIRKLPNRDALVKILTSSNYKEIKHKFDMTFPQSRAEGGPIVGYSPHPKADNIPVNATAGEFMQPVSSVKHYGMDFMERLRTRSIPRAALGLADGGLVTRTIRINTSAATSGAALPDVGYMAARMGRYMGEAMSANFQKQFDAWGKKHADGLGDPAHVSNPRGLTSYHGGTFTRLFVANLKAAERAAGKTYSIYQGGFRPSTSYSGSTHNMDAVDARVDYVLLRAFRRFVGAMGDRTGLGNWMSHMHGVPAPGHGYGSPSARAQYQDYLRRGGGSQSPRSPWGLAYGGVMTKPSLIGVAERGPERVLSAYQTKQFDRLVSTISGSGGGTTIVINVDAPRFVGSNKDLAAEIFKLAQTGDLKKSIRKAGVGV